MFLRLNSPVFSGLFIFTVMLALSACTDSSKYSSSPVLQVNAHSLSVKEFGTRLAHALRNYDAFTAKDPTTIKHAKNNILRSFIVESLALDYATANNISISSTELDKEINKVRSQYPDDIAFRRVLAEDDLSFSDWKDGVRQSLLQQKIIASLRGEIEEPRTEEVKQYYNENIDRYRRKERIYLRQIVVDDLAKAESIRSELRRVDFSELAKKFSVAPEAKTGGLLGWVEKGSVEIFDKAFSLPLGGTSKILESVYGFHIFKVERRVGAGQASLDEVKQQIVGQLKAKKEQALYMGWLDKQLRTSRVLKDTALIDAISVEVEGE